MAYEKQTYKNGSTVLTAEHMTNIENELTAGFTLRPFVELGALNNSTGNISESYYEQKYFRTAKYIKPCHSKFYIKTSVACQYSLFEYDENFLFLEASNYIDCEANTEIEITVKKNCKYVKLLFRKSASLEAMTYPTIILSNVDKQEFFNIRNNSNDGYQRLIIPVNVANASAWIGTGGSSAKTDDFLTPTSIKYDTYIDETTGVATPGPGSVRYIFTISDSQTLYASGYSPSASGSAAGIAYFDVNGKFLGAEHPANSLTYSNYLLTIPSGTTAVSIHSTSRQNAPTLSTTKVTGSGINDWDLLDSRKVLPDYGLLVLPKTYSNIGKPTRLIIYCHGAGVNYADNVTRFPTTDCRPEYWLAEGYAVMDIEGNPYDNTNEHFFIPEARQCYEHAYQWVVNNYNICTDGIFLGGRSMGGCMCLDMVGTSIPILAMCPVAPCTNAFWLWSHLSADRKKFMYDHMGLPKDTRPTLSSGTCTEAEWKYLYDNYDLWLKYSPMLRHIVNLPNKDELFNATKGHAWTEKTVDTEIALYSTLRVKLGIPTKMFCAIQDAAAIYGRNTKLYYMMMENAGEICELRLFDSDATSDYHHFELLDSRAFINHTTVYGETINAPLVYVEMLQFWRRYEKSL